MYHITNEYKEAVNRGVVKCAAKIVIGSNTYTEFHKLIYKSRIIAENKTLDLETFALTISKLN